MLGADYFRYRTATEREEFPIDVCPDDVDGDLLGWDLICSRSEPAGIRGDPGRDTKTASLSRKSQVRYTGVCLSRPIPGVE